jgi:ABC-type nitrate/sulfonate/bicarbonate transport system ATPase subunit
MTTPLVELREASKHFGPVAAGDRLSLTIAAGEFLTRLGASGSGKTTTLRLIAGFEPPSAARSGRHGAQPADGPTRGGAAGVHAQPGRNCSDLFPHRTAEHEFRCRSGDCCAGI